LNPNDENSGWREYWRADRPASCMPENPATSEEIALQWVRWFAELREGAHVLDVATGNGIVLGHAARAARETGRSFQLTGVDLAQIDPVRYVSTLEPGLRTATFRGGVPAERLPFAAETFDVVTSQYGLEYADLDAALNEAARVLVAGGLLRWLAHSEGSEVVAQHREQVREVDFLLADAGPLQVMDAFVRGMERRSDMRLETDALLQAFASAESFCRSHPPARVVRQVCGEFAQVAQRWGAYDHRDLANMLADGRRELEAHRLRVADLLRAVLTGERRMRVRQLLGRAPWTDASLDELRVGDGASLIGLLITARR